MIKLKKWIVLFLVTMIVSFLAACGGAQEEADSAEPEVEGEEISSEEPTVEEEDLEVSEEEYIVAVANENDETLSVIYYPEGRQEVVLLDGEAHNVEVNKETNLVWLTINPPHGHREEESHGHGDEQTSDAHGHGDEQGPTIVAYDLNTLEKVEEYPVGDHPAHVSITQDGNIVIGSNSGDNTVTIIERATGEITRIVVGQYPHGLRISPDQQYVYVANMNSADVSIIDLKTKEEINRIPVGEGAVQTGFSHDGKYAFAGLHADNQLAIIDTEVQEVIEKVDVGVGPVQMYASYDNKYVVVANQGSEENPSNTVTVISLEDFQEVKEVTVGFGAHGIVISDDSRYAFITNMFEETISVVDLETLEEVEKIEVGEYPNGISIN
ncbi:YncE family protein [Anaerobacillus sp. MEB173]|uniref:YncE family protein n=1 Tax=Anaerobacillus sp. MEB173 TaxID=3383345 RepID=UPI003F8DB8B6